MKKTRTLRMIEGWIKKEKINIREGWVKIEKKIKNERRMDEEKDEDYE